MYENTKSGGEKDVFQWFKEDTTTKDWVVLHSQNLPEHPSLMVGEMDFLVLAPNYGIFALEVKTGDVWRKDGIWYFRNRNGKVDSNKRGPFDQAKDGVFSIMDQVKRHYGNDSPLSKLLFNYAVCFIGLDFPDKDDPAWDAEQVFDRSNGNQISSFIRGLSKRTCKKWESLYSVDPLQKLPTKEQVDELAQFFRKDFEVVRSLSAEAKSAEDKLVSLTTKQYEVLDALADNDRTMVLGGAGTGKTLLALEEARRFEGTNLGIFCFNNNLGSWFSKICNDQALTDKVSFVGTFSSFMLKTVISAGMVVDKKLLETPTFFETILPQMFGTAITNHPIHFTKIIVDEAQDLICSDNLLFFDCILDGGLRSGKFSFYADFDNQSLFKTTTEKDALTLIRGATGVALFRLKENCRNTIKICNEIELVTGIRYNDGPDWRVEGPAVDHRLYEDSQDESKQLRALLNDLAKQISLNDVVVLSHNKIENSCVSSIGIIKQFAIPKPSGPTFCTIAGFKGLESRVIILCDVCDYDNYLRELYVALSRAKVLLIVFETRDARQQRAKLVMGKMGDEP